MLARNHQQTFHTTQPHHRCNKHVLYGLYAICYTVRISILSETHVFEIKRDSWFSSESRTTKLWKPLHFQHFCAGEMKYFQQYSFHMHIAQCTCPAHSSTIIAAATTTTTITTIANYLWIFTYEARIIDRHTNIHTIIQKRVFFMLAKNCIVFLGSGGGVCFFSHSSFYLFENV